MVNKVAYKLMMMIMMMMWMIMTTTMMFIGVNGFSSVATDG